MKIREIQMRDAKASHSAMVEAVTHGEPALITRHGKPTAVMVGYSEWQRLSRVPSFARLLTSAPLEMDDVPGRDQSPLRDFDV